LSIYLDYNATAPLRASAKAALLEAYEQVGNPASAHTYGRHARSYVDHARRVIQGKLDAPGTRVIFTSGGTEANNLALRGLTDSVFISAIEHSAVRNAQEGAHIIPVSTDGIVDLQGMERLVQDAPRGSLVSVMLANNETGVIEPVQDVARLARQYGHFTHTDAVQAVGKLPISFRELGVDMMSISAHKFGGPMGVGALIVREDLQLNPIMRGGGQEFGMRSGTVPAPMIHALDVALVDAIEHMSDYEELGRLREKIEKSISPPGVIHCQAAPRLPNTICVSMPGAEAQLQLMAFDLAGIAISVGSACSSGKVKTSSILKAMGVDETLASQAVRVSLGYNTTETEVDQFIEQWHKVYNNAQKGKT
jgi:cysteine desulfurase